MRPLTLGEITKPLLLEAARAELARFSDAAAVAFSSTPNLGGSLRTALRKTKIRATKTFANIMYHLHGQKLLWLLRGTKRQQARPVESVTDVDTLAARLEARMLAAFESYDREAA